MMKRKKDKFDYLMVFAYGLMIVSFATGIIIEGVGIYQAFVLDQGTVHWVVMSKIAGAVAGIGMAIGAALMRTIAKASGFPI